MVKEQPMDNQALPARLMALGFAMDDAQAQDAFQRHAEMEQQGRGDSEASLSALMAEFPAMASEWKVLRTELRCTMGPNASQYARLELSHPERGRISDIAKGDGQLSAAFNAIQNILGVTYELLALDVRTTKTAGEFGFVADIELDVQGFQVHGRAHGPDLIATAINAFLYALGRGQTLTNMQAQNQSQPAAQAS